jgi:hypothetical protein
MKSNGLLLLLLAWLAGCSTSRQSEPVRPGDGRGYIEFTKSGIKAIALWEIFAHDYKHLGNVSTLGEEASASRRIPASAGPHHYAVSIYGTTNLVQLDITAREGMVVPVTVAFTVFDEQVSEQTRLREGRAIRNRHISAKYSVKIIRNEPFPIAK